MNELRKNLGEANLELDRCMSCGLCLDDCPTYTTTGRSTSSPRGRMRLMMNLIKGTIDINDKVPYTNVSVRHELETCLGCLGCNTSCPADIQHTDMFECLKMMFFKNNPQYKEQLKAFLKEMPIDNPKKFRTLMILLFVAKRTGAIWITQNTPLKYLLPSTKRNMVKLLAKKIPYRPSSRVLSGFNPAIGKKKMRVGVFLGCINDHMFAEVNIAMVRVLQRLGAEVLVPKTEACCGAIHQHMGEREISSKMAIENCERFLDMGVDTIAVNAAGCGLRVKAYTRALPHHPVIQKIGPKFKDIHEIIWELLEMNPALKNQWIWPGGKERYTYHDACHLVHGQGISDIPRKLLQCIQGLEYISLKESTMCCGSAGTYNIFHPELAQKIQSRKIMNILDTKASIVAVGNSGCSLQILSGLKEKGKSNVKCYHPVEMIDISWRKV
ncbi:MAG TPA: (Fe-S)-binding protein [Phycisphaerales bacterium]|nr:(Fe-S)-binding protein [Phycisphaerales bacterium]